MLAGDEIGDCKHK
uniref:Uncharacterized protein n=1 Tax=Anguilla anguilla TaxID=7936 RepID=A0A0E9SC85_ANGAN